jgi:hypothetical protein
MGRNTRYLRAIFCAALLVACAVDALQRQPASLIAQADTSWLTTTVPGITLQYPAGWETAQPDFRKIASVDLILAAPICGTATVRPCRSSATENLVVRVYAQPDRLDEANGPWRAALRKHGYSFRDTTIQGKAATLIEAPPESQRLLFAIIVVPVEGVTYRFILEATPALRSDGMQILQYMVEQAQFAPQALKDLEQQILAVPAPQLPAAQSVQLADAIYLPLNKTNMLAYVRTYTFDQPYSNSDLCYIGNVGEPLHCVSVSDASEDRPTLDGAHFVGCALNAGGLKTPDGQPGRPTCGEDNNPASVFSGPPDQLPIIDFATLTPLNPPHPGWREVSFDQVQPADLIVFAPITDVNQPCWAGIATERSTDLVRFATHSISDDDRSIKSNGQGYACRWNGAIITATARYLTIDVDPTPPEIILDQPPPYDYQALPIIVNWTATDNESAITSFRVEQLVGITWTLLVTTTEPTAALDLEMCSQTTIRVVATNAVGLSATSTPVVISVLQQGDLNRDGIVDPRDVTLLDGPLEPRFDMTSDASVNQDDRVWLLQHLGEQCSISGSQP